MFLPGGRKGDVLESAGSAVQNPALTDTDTAEGGGTHGRAKSDSRAKLEREVERLRESEEQKSYELEREVERSRASEKQKSYEHEREMERLRAMMQHPDMIAPPPDMRAMMQHPDMKVI
jgi:hypothetical protein